MSSIAPEEKKTNVRPSISFDISKIRFTREQITEEILGALPVFVFLFLTLAYLETLVHLSVFGNTTAFRIYPVIFSMAASMLLTAFICLLREKHRKLAVLILAGILCFIYSSQLIYFRIFGSFFSMSQLKMGGDAITSFFKETVACVKANTATIILLFVPVFAGLFILKKKDRSGMGKRFIPFVCFMLIFVLLHVSCLGVLAAGGTGSFTAYETYHSPDSATDKSVRTLGVLTTARLELYSMLTGQSSNALANIGDENTGEEIEPVDTSPNVVYGLDFAALKAVTDDEDIMALNNYFATQTGSYRNEYTGLFEGKSIITICAESFSPYLIDKETMPTLYRLANGGFVFTNFYNSFPNTTTNGEYAMMTGLMPDFTRYKYDASMQYSIYCDMPYVLGNVYKSIGGNTYAYHNFQGYYYEREDIYPHYGYDTCKFMDDGMYFSDVWPSSDLEMMEQSVDDYINDSLFTAHYMTFSGHYQYDFDLNPMCDKNYDYTKDMDHSYAIRAYISCNYELEKALEYLVSRLEEAGRLDDVVIVLTGDHYPYGLSEEEYNELAGKPVETVFEKYRGSFICYNSSIEPVVCDNYCCNIDILPTLLNLIGYEYDSRILAGTDALCEGAHIAVLSDGSFLTDRIRFDANLNEVYYQDEGINVTDGYINAYKNIAANKFTISNAILYNDYYYFLICNFVPPEPEPEGSPSQLPDEYVEDVDEGEDEYYDEEDYD